MFVQYGIEILRAVMYQEIKQCPHSGLKGMYVCVCAHICTYYSDFRNWYIKIKQKI